MLASDGHYEETFAVQHDAWEAHVPAHLRRRKGRTRDERALELGMPPVEPMQATLYDIAEEVRAGMRACVLQRMVSLCVFVCVRAGCGCARVRVRARFRRL